MMDWQRAYQKASEILGERTKERDEMRAELTRLRGIEAAVRSIAKGVDGHPETDYRNMAIFFRDHGFPFRAMICEAIADALEEPQ